MRRSLFTILVTPALAGALAVTLMSQAEAGFRRLRSDYEPGEVITVQSHFGNGRASGIVRPAKFGWEVQLPHGTWVSCRRSCEDTLRVQTVDLTETDGTLTGYGTLQQECGVFGCLRLNF